MYCVNDLISMICHMLISASFDSCIFTARNVIQHHGLACQHGIPTSQGQSRQSQETGLPGQEKNCLGIEK